MEYKKYLVAYYNSEYKFISTSIIRTNIEVFTEQGIEHIKRMIQKEADIKECSIINIIPLND